MRKMMIAAALAASSATLAAPAAAQLIQAPAGLVVVNLGDIEIGDVLSDIELDVLRNANILSGNNVAVPVSVAAAVCGINVAALAQQKSRTGGCDADSENGDLTQLTSWLQNRARAM